MQSKLLFITNQCWFQPTKDALARIGPNCETKVVVYDDFEHIPQVYAENVGSFDAVFISGSSAKRVLDMAYPNLSTPVVAFQAESDALHRDILRYAVEAKNPSFHRMAVDFLLPLGAGVSVVDFLKLKSMNTVIQENAELVTELGVCGDGSIENIILKKIIDLWEQNAIDMVFCMYAINAPKLRDRGIPFRSPFISDDLLGRMIQTELVKIELGRLHDTHPAIIQVFTRNAGDTCPENLRRIHSALDEFVRANLMDGMLQESGKSCIVITTMGVLRFVTGEFATCSLSAYLTECLNFPVSVAYGIGTTVTQAMNNVQIASKEAILMGKPFVVDSNGNLIGPLNSKGQMIIGSNVMPDISEMARRCHLSVGTIQKVMTIIKSANADKITIPDLADQLGTTVRNANRVMMNLCRGEVAKPAYTKSSHTRGRPVQVYSLDFKQYLS